MVVGDYRGQCPAPPPNLHFLGLRAQRDVPAYLAAADVALIPWKVSAITEATSPLKLYEYLAMQLPVVAPDLPPLHGVPFVLHTRDADDFVAKVAEARHLHADSAKLAAFLRDSSWQARVPHLIELITRAGR